MKKAGLLAALMVAGASLFASPAMASDPIRIGLIGTWSGPYADYGRQFDAGIQVYLEQNGGKIAGRDVEIIRRDTAGPAPDAARRFAQELIVRNRVNFITGLDFSPNAYAVAPIVTQARMPTIVINASSSGITEASEYIARVSFTPQQVSAPMAEWALKNGISEVYTVVADYSPGVDSEEAFKNAFTAGGGRIVGELRTPMNNPDFSAYVQRIRDAKPEAVFFFFPSGVQPPAFLKAYEERGLAEAGIQLIATGEATDDSYLEATGDVALGLITSHHYSYAHPSEMNQQFIRDFRQSVGDSMRPSYFAVAAYDGMTAIAKALEKTGGDMDGDKVMEALKGLQFESPRGPIEIDASTRDIIQTVYIRRTEKVEGELVNVEFDAFERVKDPGKEAK